jgi:hypothetical protein
MANGDVAYLRKNSNGLFQVCYQPMSATGPMGAVRTGPELPSTAQFGQFYPSPDEQWVAFSQANGRGNRTVLLSADGKTTRSIGSAGESFSTWLPDSRSFLSLCIQPRPGMKVTHLDTPRTEFIAALTPLEMPSPMFEFANGPDFQIGRYFNNSQPNAGPAGNAPTITVRSFPMSKPDVVRKTWTVPVPPGCQDAVAYVSPDRKHLLWITVTIKPPVTSTWLNGAFGTRSPMPNYETHCYLSDLNGNNRRPIMEDVARRFGEVSPSWTPDGKHLSFLYQNQLYLVPID